MISTKDIVRDLDNLQYRKMKKLIMIDGFKNDGSENSVIEDNSQIDVIKYGSDMHSLTKYCPCVA